MKPFFRPVHEDFRATMHKYITNTVLYNNSYEEYALTYDLTVDDVLL